MPGSILRPEAEAAADAAALLGERIYRNLLKLGVPDRGETLVMAGTLAAAIIPSTSNTIGVHQVHKHLTG